jgi:hypothetical protein
MESILRNVSDIQSGEKHSLEGLLGHSLHPDQRVFIMVLDSGTIPDDNVRQAARAKLEMTFAQTDVYADKHGITAEEVDAAVEEAMNAVRNAPR